MSQFQDSIGRLSSGKQGIFVACILLASSLSSLLSGFVADAISRRFGIMTGGLLSIIRTVISSVAPSFPVLIVARIITGFGVGQAIAVTTVYLVELAPREIRGVAACMLQTYVVLGITVEYFVSFGSRELHGPIAWRTPFIVQACVAFFMTAGMLFLPFSPRWLAQKGRMEDARRVLAKLRSHELVEPELEEIRAALSSHSPEDSTSWFEMFQSRYIGRTCLGIFLMAFQQLTGVRTPINSWKNVANIDRSTWCYIMLPFCFSKQASGLNALHFLHLV